MKTVINAACITNHGTQILLVSKFGIWILPGGKIQDNESDSDCLLREFKEELPSVNLIIGSFYDSFTGITPHTGDQLCARVYLGQVIGDIKPSAEISQSGFFTVNQIPIMPLSNTTRRIVESLIDKNYLR